MSRQLLSVVVFCGVLSTIAADTIPGGEVYGTWYAANSPYYIVGDISIPVDSTLNIEPGVVVDFQPWYYFQVNGFLEAGGTITDSIHFLCSGGTWLGIDFENAPDSSHLAYCTVQNVDDLFGPHHGAITCYMSNPVITHCRITENWQTYYGFYGAGGIYLHTSSPVISWCNISQNHSPWLGGGIHCKYNSSPVIEYCDIRENSTNTENPTGAGGGIYVTGGCSPVITNCTIEGNTSINGGGIACQDGSVTINECTIANNLANGYNCAGAGIWIAGGAGCNGIITRSTIDSNAVVYNIPGPGGGIYANCETLLVDHCTFVDNSPADYGAVIGWAIHTEGNTALLLTNSIVQGKNIVVDRLIGLFSASVSISYSDFYQYRDAFVGNLPPGLGELTQVNYNGDSCDVYCNIFLDPLFVDYSNADYHLLLGSPCIDAGDPAFAYDPDSTITDMGRYWFNQTGVAEISITRTSNHTYRGATIFRGPLQLPEGKKCKVFDITGRLVEPDKIQSGIYFIEVDGVVTQKVVRVR
jgi:hypothetical protein